MVVLSGYAVENYFSLGTFADEGEEGHFHGLFLIGEGDDYSQYQVVRKLVSFDDKSFGGVTIKFLYVAYNRVFAEFKVSNSKRCRYGEIEFSFDEGKVTPVLIRSGRVSTITGGESGFAKVKFSKESREKELWIPLDRQCDFYNNITEKTGNNFRQEVRLIKAYRDEHDKGSDEYVLVNKVLQSHCRLKKPKWIPNLPPLQEPELSDQDCKEDQNQVSSTADYQKVSSGIRKRSKTDNTCDSSSQVSSSVGRAEEKRLKHLDADNEADGREIKKSRTLSDDHVAKAFKEFQKNYQAREAINSQNN